jgi:hypothetical protein
MRPLAQSPVKRNNKNKPKKSPHLDPLSGIPTLRRLKQEDSLSLAYVGPVSKNNKNFWLEDGDVAQW